MGNIFVVTARITKEAGTSIPDIATSLTGRKHFGTGLGGGGEYSRGLTLQGQWRNAQKRFWGRRKICIATTLTRNMQAPGGTFFEVEYQQSGRAYSEQSELIAQAQIDVE